MQVDHSCLTDSSTLILSVGGQDIRDLCCTHTRAVLRVRLFSQVFFYLTFAGHRMRCGGVERPAIAYAGRAPSGELLVDRTRVGEVLSDEPLVNRARRRRCRLLVLNRLVSRSRRSFRVLG
jgi:hypothetical protein